MTHKTIAEALAPWSRSGAGREQVVETVTAIAQACGEIADLTSQGALAGELGASTGRVSGVDPQKKLDIIANDKLLEALASAPVAAMASEELLEPQTLTQGAPLLVAADPIDGSSNIEANFTIGTIFSVLPAISGDGDTREFLQPGTRQLAAGFVTYGPATTLTLTVGDGTLQFTRDHGTGRFLLTNGDCIIPIATQEYAINASNYRYWDDVIRTYTDDLLRGREGPRGKNFNMRWTASPVADFQRIVSRGGVFLYPGDLRDGYALGRLRLVYEANPLAFVMEQAGGAASSGRQRILEIVPSGLHQHTPLIAGSRSEVEYLVRLAQDPYSAADRSPLFGRRGLFRS